MPKKKFKKETRSSFPGSSPVPRGARMGPTGAVEGTIAEVNEVYRAPYSNTFVKPSGLADSGARQASVSGGLREPSDGAVRGRFDLIPAECLEAIYSVEASEAATSLPHAIAELSVFLGRAPHGAGAAVFCRYILMMSGSLQEGIRRLAVHYGKGAKKYTTHNSDGTVLKSGDRNWERGLETGRCIDSAWRHLGELQAGAQNEDHASAVVWNIFATMWYVPRIVDGRLPRVLDTYGLVPE